MTVIELIHEHAFGLLSLGHAAIVGLTIRSLATIVVIGAVSR